MFISSWAGYAAGPICHDDQTGPCVFVYPTSKGPSGLITAFAWRIGNRRHERVRGPVDSDDDDAAGANLFVLRNHEGEREVENVSVNAESLPPRRRCGDFELLKFLKAARL